MKETASAAAATPVGPRRKQLLLLLLLMLLLLLLIFLLLLMLVSIAVKKFGQGTSASRGQREANREKVSIKIGIRNEKKR